MTDWRPASGPDAAASRAALLRRVRAYLDATEVLEVDTPALSPSAVSDVHIESFEIANNVIGDRPLYLHTSPEFFMKRLLAAGYPDIYSICRVFRDGEAGRKHQPEFTMIEWYRLGMNLGDIIHDTIQLIDAALDGSISLNTENRLDYAQALKVCCDIDIRAASVDELARVAGADDRLRRAVGDDRDGWLDLLLSTRVIPEFPPDRLTVLQHYPASQGALARLCPDDPNCADRFEVFLGPVELANGYVELTDAAEQAARIVADNQSRERCGQAVRPVDQHLLAALATGLPDCAGVAMGLERLQMIHDKTDDIRDVITFAFEPGA